MEVQDCLLLQGRSLATVGGGLLSLPSFPPLMYMYACLVVVGFWRCVLFFFSCVCVYVCMCVRVLFSLTHPPSSLPRKGTTPL
jgi:hypothetical protein